ncbi:MAG: LamG-like jellyroll fold domain-containing protein, partial [Pseudomonadota bacterium]
AASRRPSITLDASGAPVVAWTEISGSSTQILTARWNGSAWVSLGALPGSGGGDSVQLVTTATNVTAVWTEAGGTQLSAATLSGGSWSAAGGAPLAVGGPVSVAAEGGQVTIAWANQGASDTLQVRTLSGGGWTTVGNPLAGDTVTTPRDISAPTVAILNGVEYLAWSESGPDTGEIPQIFAKRFNGSAWVDVGTLGDGQLTDSFFGSIAPKLAANGSDLKLAWIDQRMTFGEAYGALMVAELSGGQFVAQVPGDTSADGVARFDEGLPTSFAFGIGPSGDTAAVWGEKGERAGIHVRADDLAEDQIFTATAGTTIQDILDNNTLGAGDIIALAPGDISGNVTIGAGDSGVTIIGGLDSRVLGSVTVTGNDVTVQNLRLSGAITVSQASGATIHENDVGGGITIDRGTGADVADNTINAFSTGISLEGGTAASYSGLVLSDTPLGYWRLNDAGGLVANDVVGLAGDGTYFGAIGPGDGALEGDSDGGVVLNGTNGGISVADGPFNTPAQITVEAWVRPETGIGSFDSVVSKASSSAWTDGFGVWYQSGRINAYINNFSTVRVDAPITLNEWSHVVFTYDGAQLTLYLNGQLVDTEAFNAPINHASQPLLIGRGTGSSSYTWTGGLDEVALYGRALTGAEALEHYELGLLTGAGLGTGPSDVAVRDNAVSSRGTGIGVVSQIEGQITANEVRASNTGLLVRGDTTGVIGDNALFGGSLGIDYGAGAELSGNLVDGAETGIETDVTDPTRALGYVGSSLDNIIANSEVGILLVDGAIMQGQIVRDGVIGITGIGTVGGASLATAPLVFGNDIGISGLDGLIQNVEVGENRIGISAATGGDIFNAIVFRSEEVAILADGVDNVRIANATLYSPTGDMLRVEGGSTNIELTSSILYAETGYAIFIDNDSRTGFYSDFNALYFGDTGTLGFYTRDFFDILDWQADIARFDLNSIGRTVIDPDWATPRFADIGQDDYRILDQAAGLRFTSPNVHHGDQSGGPLAVNALVNGGFENTLTGWTTNGAAVANAGPGPFEGAAVFNPGNAAVGFANQQVDLLAQGFTGTQIDAGTIRIAFGGRIFIADQQQQDEGSIRITFRDENQNALFSTEALRAVDEDRWVFLSDQVAVPQNARFADFEFDATRRGTGNNVAYLDDAFLTVFERGQTRAQGAILDPVEVHAIASRIEMRAPDLYKDIERDRPFVIRWDSFGASVGQPVRIDLMRQTADGPELVTTIAGSTPDDGEFIWIPSSSGVAFDTPGLSIRVSYANLPEAFDFTTETFTVPEDGDNYYVDDRSNAGDQYTPGAIGDNRNTGKSPDAPKPFPTNLLRVYELSAGDTLFIDTGDYPLIDALTISGATDRGFGLDEGFEFLGPTNGGTATLFAAVRSDNPAALIELDNADFITIRNLTLDGGQRAIWAFNGSDSLNISDIVAVMQTGTAFGIASDSPFGAFERLTATASGGRGFFFDGAFDLISNLTATDTGDDGVFLTGSVNLFEESTITNPGDEGLELDLNATSLFEANLITGASGAGVIVDGNTTSGTVFGSTDFTRGNRVQNSGSNGIDANGALLVIGNVVFGSMANGTYGIISERNAETRSNVVYNSRNGILGTQIFNNRVFGITDIGIVLSSTGATIAGNVVYNANIGIETSTNSNSADSIRDNLIYNITTTGIRLDNGANHNVIGNTFFLPAATQALEIVSTTTNVTVADNIFSMGAGAAITVDNGSQPGFASDDNLFQLTGSGIAGIWQGVNRANLAAWQAATFGDAR